MSKWRSLVNISLIDFSARLSYNVARTPLLPLFALYLGASPSLIGIIFGASTVTGIFLKAPSGALSDHIGRKKMLLFGALIFAVMPFSYIFVTAVWMLIIIRIIHGMATSCSQTPFNTTPKIHIVINISFHKLVNNYEVSHRTKLNRVIDKEENIVRCPGHTIQFLNCNIIYFSLKLQYKIEN